MALISRLPSGGINIPKGVSALATGVYTPSSDISTYAQIEHNLGVKPNFCIWMIEDDFSTHKSKTYLQIMGTMWGKEVIHGVGGSTIYPLHYSISGYDYNGTLIGTKFQLADESYMTASQIRLIATTDLKLKAGYNYRWVCGVADDIK